MKNDISDKMTVKYDEVRVALLRKEGVDIKAYSARELFINGNFPNKKDINEETFELLTRFNNKDNESYPVVLYLEGNEMTGWYNPQTAQGYIAE